MSKGENIFKSKDGRWEARYIKGYDLSGKIKYGFCYLPPACPHPETDRWKRQRKSLRPGTSGSRRKTGRIAEARNNGQNYRFSKLLSYPHYELYLCKGMDASLPLIFALLTGTLILDYRP